MPQKQLGVDLDAIETMSTRRSRSASIEAEMASGRRGRTSDGAGRATYTNKSTLYNMYNWEGLRHN